MSLGGFREAYSYDAGNASFSEQQTNGLAAGRYSQYFSFTPRNGKTNVLGAVFKFIGVATATGPETPVAGTDSLDLFIGGNSLSQGGDVEVAAAAGASEQSASPSTGGPPSSFGPRRPTPPSPSRRPRPSPQPSPRR